MRERLLVSMIPAVACLAFAAPAPAATQEGASENWAGYVVTSNDGSGFSAASGQWTQAGVDCTANSQSSGSAYYWVGLGGGAPTPVSNAAGYLQFWTAQACKRLTAAFRFADSSTFTALSIAVICDALGTVPNV